MSKIWNSVSTFCKNWYKTIAKYEILDEKKHTIGKIFTKVARKLEWAVVWWTAMT